MRWSSWILAVMLSTACGGLVVEQDAGAQLDAGAPDAGAPDAGAPDAGVADAGTADAGVADAGTADAGVDDAGTTDAGVDDAGTSDAGADDAGTSDAGATDGGTSDAGPLSFCATSTCRSSAGETCWSCWAGRPDSGADVVVPLGERILLDESIDVATLNIAGELTTAPVALTVRARQIEVSGSWRAGTPLDPHPVGLHVRLAGPGKQVRVVGAGEVSLHGPFALPVFTSLADAVDAGSTQVPLAVATTWAPGDEVVITPSGHYEGTLSAFSFRDGGRGPTDFMNVVASTGATLDLSSALTSPRHGILDAGAPVDLRAEIASLTREIVFEGEDDDAWDAGVGVQVFAQGPAARLTLEGVRLHRAGARAQLRSAAVVMHTLSADAGVLRGSVVTSAPRALELVATSGALVTDNVFARLEGHGVWLVTGLERDNVLERNLVTHLRPPRAPGPFNATELRSFVNSVTNPGMCGASAFVISNPDNVVRGNVASDLDGCGFWLSFATRPRDLAANIDLSPRRVAFGTFEDNRSHSTAASGVMLNYAIAADAGVDVVESVAYQPQSDERATAGTDFSSTLRATLTRTTVLGTQLSASRLVGRIQLVAPVMWSSGGQMLSLRGDPTVEIEDGLFVGKLGTAPQPFEVSGALVAAAGPDSIAVTRSRVAHFESGTTGLGLFTPFGNPVFGFDLTLERWTQIDVEGVTLGQRPSNPAPNSVTGPVLDASGLGGFPGRWWVDDQPYFTQGHVCTPSPFRTGASGQLCASDGYFGVANIQAGTGVGTTTALSPNAELVRVITGSPSVGLHSPLAEGIGRGLPVPANETVELRLPDYPVTPRRLKFLTWGRPGQRAVLRIPYPAGTTFVITARNEFGASTPPPVTFTQAASMTELTNDATGTRYFWSGGYLHLSLRSDFRTRTTPYFTDPILITATGSTLP